MTVGESWKSTDFPSYRFAFSNERQRRDACEAVSVRARCVSVEGLDVCERQVAGLV